MACHPPFCISIRGADSSYALIYLPIGKTVTVRRTHLSGREWIAGWFNPKDGTVEKMDRISKRASMEFTPPSTGMDNDWVLVLDDTRKNYPAPGEPRK